MDQSKTFREKLLGINTEDTDDGDYRDRIQTMLNKKLSPSARILYGFVGLVSLIATLYFGSWVFKTNYQNELPAFLMRLMCGAGMIFSGILTFFAGWSAVTAKVRGRFYPGFIISSAAVILIYFWGALIYMMFIFPMMMELANSSKTPYLYTSIMGIQLMLLGFFAMVAVGFILSFRLLSDLKYENRSKLLEIEYKLYEVTETSKK
jgi:hypothetical protein